MLEFFYGIENESAIDPLWSLVHFVSGIVVGLAIWHLMRRAKKKVPARWFTITGFSLLVIWEYVEVLLRFIKRYSPATADKIALVVPEGFLEVESLANIIGDLLIGSLGLCLAYAVLNRLTPRSSASTNQ